MHACMQVRVAAAAEGVKLCLMIHEKHPVPVPQALHRESAQPLNVRGYDTHPDEPSTVASHRPVVSTACQTS